MKYTLIALALSLCALPAMAIPECERDTLIREIAKQDKYCRDLEVLVQSYHITVESANMVNGKQVEPVRVEFWPEYGPNISGEIAQYLREQKKYLTRLIDKLQESVKDKGK